MTAGDGRSRRSSVLSVVQRHVDAFNDRDVERLCAGVAPDIVFVTGQDTVSGADAVRDFFADAFSGSAQLRLEIRSSVVEGDLAACDYASRSPSTAKHITIRLRPFFEPFWRADPARSTEGAGLGLTLAKRIVESLGGRIDAASAPARGSRFQVVLPY